MDTVYTKDVTMNEVIEKMIGRSYEAMFPERPAEQHPDVVLKCENITNGIAVQNASFELHRGEILGIGGLVGAGKTEMARAIFGADKGCSGTITMEGKTIHVNSPHAAIRHSIAYLPESRKEDGVLLTQSVRMNTKLAALHKISKYGIMSIDMQTAMINDMAVIKDDGTPVYIDNSDIMDAADNQPTLVTVNEEKAPEVPEMSAEEAFFAKGTL